VFSLCEKWFAVQTSLPGKLVPFWILDGSTMLTTGWGFWITEWGRWVPCSEPGKQHSGICTALLGGRSGLRRKQVCGANWVVDSLWS